MPSVRFHSFFSLPFRTVAYNLVTGIDEAMRDWVTNLATTHYLVGSAIGPAPFPTIVRDFQSVIGQEIKSQMADLTGRLPDAVIACVGGGSNAIGTFHPFIEDKSVRIVGVEAAGEGGSLLSPSMCSFTMLMESVTSCRC